MISLRFAGGLEPRSDLHAEYVRFVGDKILDDSDNEIATHGDGWWKAGDQVFTTIGIVSPSVIVFEEPGESFGPYRSVWVVNGSIRTGENQRDLLARLDKSVNRWQCSATAVVSSSIVVRSP